MAPPGVEGLSADKRFLLEQRLHGRAAPPPRTSGPLTRRMGSGPVPLSPLQEQLWYFSQLAPENPVYNEAVTIRKDGPFQVRAFRAAFNEIVRRHEIWRSTFDVADGEPVQVVHPAPTLELPVVDLSGMPAAERESEAARMAAEEARRPYDLARGPLLRPLLVRFADDHHRLYLALHHLIFDGVSLYRIVLPELIALYDSFSAGCEPSLPEPPIQYADYAAAAREGLMGIEFAHRIDYWRHHLDGAPTLQLPLDSPRPPHQRFRGAMERVHISRELADELRTLSRTSGATLFQVLSAAFAVLLHRYCGQDDIVFGTLSDMRDRRELEGMVGYCLTPLVIRANVRDEPSFMELLSRVRGDLLDGLSHQVPFELLVRELHPRRDPGANPIFQAVLVLEPAIVCTDPAWSLHQMEAEVGNAVGHAKFDLHLELDQRPDGHIDGRLIYNTDLFAPETATRIARHWSMLLEGIVRAPSGPVCELSLLTEEERQRQLVEWNATSADYPRNACVHELVMEQVQRTPDAVAVVFGDEQLTYRELDRRANRVVHLLSRSDARNGLVAICVERSLEMLVGMLGILKCGAGYLPLDPHYPADRLALMLEDSGAAVLLTHRHLLPTLPEHRADVICLEDESTAHLPHGAPTTSVTADDLAYVLYTSGSSGRPKGVCTPHRAVVNLLSSMAERPGIGPADKIVATTTYTFDIAAVELWLPLVTGGRTIIASREVASDGRRLAGLVAGSGPTIMQATPATWQMLIDYGWSGRRGLVALCGGETLTPQLADSLLDRTTAVWNMYGPTETTVWSTVAAVERGAPITIGRPIANTRVYILDRGRQPVPVGVAGEIAIGGDGVALGYLNRPDLTAERFVPDPFAPGALMYLTGDLARYLPDGRIQHLGRLDYQIKIRGFRVEPGEIEAALAASPDVAAAVVLAREQTPGDTRLVAYIVPKGATPSPSELRRRLRAALPEHMVPSIFVALDALPLSTNGKLDRGALPAPRPAADDRSTSSAAPRTAVERQVAVIWSRTLGVDRVGVNDDFFELGGHSLLALSLLIEVERELGVAVPLASLFETFTVAGLAAIIEAMDGREEGATRAEGA
jgi:amino acid adenylation domain-containing protein